MRLRRELISIMMLPATLINGAYQVSIKTSPPGEMTKTSRGMFHVVETGGKQEETIVLEAGLGGNSLHWHKVQQALSLHAHVLSYDRKGYGYSPTHSGTYTVKEAAENLKSILDARNITHPITIVAHSYGGLIARMFASLYPEHVKGIVFVDSVTEERYVRQGWPKEREDAFIHNLRMMKLGVLLSRTGLTRIGKMRVGGFQLHSDLKKLANDVGYRPSSYEAVYGEMRDSELSAKEILNSNEISTNLSITVIQSNNQDPEWLQYQAKLKSLSESVHVIFTQNGHNIHLENPNVVVEAVRQQVQQK